MLTNVPKDGGPRSFRWGLIAAATIPIFLILLSLQVARGFTETAALRAEVVRSYEARAELRRILSIHQDLETGQRGFVLTGDEKFLEPYSAAAGQVENSFFRLERDLLAETSLASALAELRRTSASKRRFSEETIALTRQGRGNDARMQIAIGEGKVLMDRIRMLIEQMDRREHEQLESYTARAEEARARLQGRTLAFQIALLLLLALAIFFAGRSYAGWQKTLARFQDLSARQEAIFASANDGMMVLDASGTIESLNGAAARMFGYEDADLVQREVSTLFEVTPGDGEVELFLKRLASKSKRKMNAQEFIGRTKDGANFPAEVTISPVALADRDCFLAVLRNVAERKQVERMKTEFVSTVSHELRTPLTSIAGSLGLITGGAAGEIPSRALRLIEIAQSNCARLIRLINDILDIEKIEAGRMVFDHQSVPLAKLLEQAAQANRAFAAEQGAMIHVDEVPEGACVIGDEDRLMQVLTNLISNAAKFSPRGGVVRMFVTPEGEQFRISIADEGPGIPPEFRARMFTKFAQADSSDTRQMGGTGLGLSIVREIVTKLGGTISFDSEPGNGTTFHVHLPADQAGFLANDEGARLGRLGSGDLPLLLHVDDDPDMLRIVSSALEGRAQVHSTPSVVEARASIVRYEFDVVILDIGLSDGSGLELIPLIRERQQARIIVFTAQEVDPALLEGADKVLVKSKDSLEQLVDEALDRRRRKGDP